MTSEKTYCECLNEISKDDLLEGLLGHGLFPDKIPPVFTSEPFYEYCKMNGFLYTQVKSQPWIHWESMRNTNVPRAFGIPTPMVYSNLCGCLAEHWNLIRDHFEAMTKDATHKVSRIHIRKLEGTKALFKMNYKNFKTDPSPEVDLLIGSKYLVRADISNCFPSIYAHSLPWALVSKKEAKIQKDQKLWFNQIDKKTRCCKHDETHGILIGPHASNLLSEIILTTIDEQLCKRWSYVRNIDDYTCYVSSHEDGQEFLKDLREKLREYDLSLNHGKTEIVSLPIGATEHWYRKMSVDNIPRNNGFIRYPAAQAYLDTAIELANESGNDAVITYAIKALSNQQLTDSAKRYCGKTILHLALVKPYFVSYLEKYVIDAYGISSDLVESFVQKLYEQAHSERNNETLAFSLYFAKKYSIALRNHDVSISINSKVCILLLFDFLYCSSIGDKVACKQISCFAKEVSNDDEMARFWLLVYEVLPASSLKGEWKKLKQAKISFIKNE